MRRLALVVLLALFAPTAEAQVIRLPIPGVTITSGGSGVAGRCALFGGTTSLTSDSGCTYAGTGATFVLSANALSLTLYEERIEAAAPSTPTNAIRSYTDTSNRNCWIGESGFTNCLDGTANTASRVYTLPNAAGTVALETGQPIGTGTMTGSVWRLASGTNCAYASVAGVATSTLVEEVALTCTIPANTLVTDGRSKIRVTAAGGKAANANAVTPRIRFGGLTGNICAATSVAASGARWVISCEITRLAFNAQHLHSLQQVGNATPTNATTSGPSFDLTTSLDIVVTLAAPTLAGDGIANLLTVEIAN